MKIGFLARVVFTVTAACMQVAVPANTAHFEITYSEPVRNLQWRNTADDSVQQKPGAGAPSTLSFEALDQGFVIRLSPNRILTRQLSLQSGQSVEVFRGIIDGMPNGWARLTVADGLPQGLIWTGSDWLGLDVLEGQTAPSLYRLSDVAIAPGAFGCDDATHLQTAHDLVTFAKPALPLSPAEAVGATQEIQIGTVGDEEFAAENGSAANAESAIIARMNIADGIFSEQVGVQLTVANVQIFNSGNDPFTDVTEARDLLDEITSFRSGSSQQRSFGLTHLFTGRDLEGNTVGIAWRRALCSSRFGAGLTQATRTSTLDSLILAHELGHNFGAVHDADPDEVCADTPDDFLMAARLNNSSTFSQCSLDTMASHISQVSCLSAISQSDVEITAELPARTVLLSDTFESRFAITNTGANVENDVTVAIAIPAAVSVSNASSTSGVCTTGAGSVDCTLGSLAIGAGATVTVNAEAQSTGLATFAGTVSAPQDANPNNNNANDTVTIDTAIDLQVLSAAATSVTVDGTTSITVSLNNLAVAEATDVTFSALSGSAFDFSSASWSDGNCTIDDGDVSCTSASFAASRQSSITLEISGISAATQNYQLSADAADIDRNTSNNQASGTVTINPAPTNSAPSDDGGGGGGALGFGTLLLLLLGPSLARQRR